MIVDNAAEKWEEPNMTADDFYRTMIEKLDRKPFQPFAVELNDGRRVEIDRPKSVSIRGGVAACSTRESIYVRVESNDVKQIIDIPASLSTTHG